MQTVILLSIYPIVFSIQNLLRSWTETALGSHLKHTVANTQELLNRITQQRLERIPHSPPSGEYYRSA